MRLLLIGRAKVQLEPHRLLRNLDAHEHNAARIAANHNANSAMFSKRAWCRPWRALPQDGGHQLGIVLSLGWPALFRLRQSAQRTCQDRAETMPQRRDLARVS